MQIVNWNQIQWCVHVMMCVCVESSQQLLEQLGAEQRNVVCHWVRQGGRNLSTGSEAPKENWIKKKQ